MEKNSILKNKKSFIIEALDLIRIVLICFVIVFICTNFLFKPVKVVGESMHPTLEDGEYGFSNIFGSLINDFNRFDVVVVNDDQTGHDNWVKRIIGMPNETIEYKNNKLYIDGKHIEQPFLDEDYTKSQTNNDSIPFTHDFGPITLKDDEYYLMGDNRLVSHDSRAVGAFKEDAIVSKSILILFPLDKIGFVNDGTK